VSIHEKLPDVSVLSFTPKGKLRRLGITNPKANEVKCYYSVGGQGLRLSLPLRTGATSPSSRRSLPSPRSRRSRCWRRPLPPASRQLGR
jgi:hypothetical protein